MASSDTDRVRTVLQKRLEHYTERNTFDFFIHKDLGDFLRGSLRGIQWVAASGSRSKPPQSKWMALMKLC